MPDKVFLVIELGGYDILAVHARSKKDVATTLFEEIVEENHVTEPDLVGARLAEGTLRFAGDDAYAVQLIEKVTL